MDDQWKLNSTLNKRIKFGDKNHFNQAKNFLRLCVTLENQPKQKVKDVHQNEAALSSLKFVKTCLKDSV